MSFPSPLPGALELADSSADLPGLKWMPGVTSWKVLERLVFGAHYDKPTAAKTNQTGKQCLSHGSASALKSDCIWQDSVLTNSIGSHTLNGCCLHSWWPRTASGTRTGPMFRAVVTHRSAPPCSRQQTPRSLLACIWRDGTHTLTRTLKWCTLINCGGL